MSVLLTEGIVTRYTNYRDYDRILSVFTINHGRIDATARACRKANSKLLPSAQPFVFGEYELIQRNGFYTVHACDIRETFYPLRENYMRFAYASAMLQLAHNAVQMEEPNRDLFFLLYHALSYICYTDMNPKDLFCCYLVRYLASIGFAPTIVTCAKCGKDLRTDSRLFFSEREGGAVCSRCSPGAKEISKLSLEAMRRMLLLSDPEIKKVALTEQMRDELLSALIGYTSYILDYGVKSMEIIRNAEKFTAEPM